MYIVRCGTLIMRKLWQKKQSGRYLLSENCEDGQCTLPVRNGGCTGITTLSCWNRGFGDIVGDATTDPGLNGVLDIA